MVQEFRDRLEWNAENGTLHDRDIPYLLIRPDSLMGIFRFLPEEDRPAAFGAFARSIAHYGRGSAESYRALGADQAETMLKTIAGTAPQLGWGIWKFDRKSDDLLGLTVVNSPFADGYGDSVIPVCAAIEGMLEAVGGLIFGEPVQARETGCASTGAAHCTFEAFTGGPDIP